MESFSLLKYWRSGGGSASTSSTRESVAKTRVATTIVTAVSPSSSSDSDDNDNNDDGPFIDLEFSLPDDENDAELDYSIEVQMKEEEEEDTSDEDQQKNQKENLVSDLLSDDNEIKLPVSSILKSATKFRLLMLKLNKSLENTKKSEDNKDVILRKYLKKVKPLYIKVSKRYGEKLNLATPSPPPLPPQATAEVKSPEETSEVVGEGVAALPNSKSLKEGLRVVCKHLGKSRSASVAPSAAAGSLTSKRTDDSLLQQQDGIQSAILHCKRSFNASTDLEGLILSRSSSETSHEKSVSLSTEDSSSSPEEAANGQRE